MRRLIEYYWLDDARMLRRTALRYGVFVQRKAYFHSFGVLVNPKALWIGGHYSEHHKRWCINILPCLTVWWAKPGGYLP